MFLCASFLAGSTENNSILCVQTHLIDVIIAPNKKKTHKKQRVQPQKVYSPRICGTP